MKAINCPNCNISKVSHKFNSNNFQIYLCEKCLNGFTYPVPKNLGKYYDHNYWISKGLLGFLKNQIYHFSQIRRKFWVMNFLQSGNILDVGAGEGRFSTLLNKNFTITSLDTPSAAIKNPNVLKVNFLQWKTNKKFDAIVFWESLEHTQHPQKYLKKAAALLKKGGYIFIEYPRFNCWESNFFKQYWFHLDPPRHLSHLTPDGVDKLLSRNKLISTYQYGVFAFEYSIGGFVSSMLALFSSHQRDFFKKSKNLLLIILLMPAFLLCVLIELYIYIIGQSPIYLTVAQKKGIT